MSVTRNKVRGAIDPAAVPVEQIPGQKTPRERALDTLLANLTHKDPAIRNWAAAAIIDRQL